MDTESRHPDKPKVVIVVPCYNEEKRLRLDAFRGFRDDRHDVRFLFVNDGSTDATERLLRTLADLDAKRFAVLSLRRNGGKAEAVRRGILEALRGEIDCVGYWDADLATPLDAIPDFCDVLDEEPTREMVFGSRVRLLGREIERRPVRHYLGRVFATAVSFALGIAVYDTQCGAKLFRATDRLASLFQEPFTSRWVFDVEIIARAIRAHQPGDARSAAAAMYEMPLKRWRDVRGSKLRISDFARAAFDLLRICRRYRWR